MMGKLEGANVSLEKKTTGKLSVYSGSILLKQKGYKKETYCDPKRATKV